MLLALHQSPRGLPSFAVTDLSSLPTLDVNSGHIVSEFHAMRAEMADLRRDVTAVKSRDSDPVTG